MRSRINSTGRRRIGHERIVILAREGSAFSVAVNLAGLDLPEDGCVVIEAHRQSITERFDFGTVADLRPLTPPSLRQMPIEEATFRVKVIDPASGRLLARADRLRSDGNAGGRRELLTVRVKDIGPEPWRTELIGGDPCLVLNDRIPGAASRITSDPVFKALVVPAAFRQVLHLLWAEHEQIEPDDDTPASRWLAFAAAVTGQDHPDWGDREAVFEWIDIACQRFSAEHDFIIALKDGDHGYDQAA